MKKLTLIFFLAAFSFCSAQTTYIDTLANGADTVFTQTVRSGPNSWTVTIENYGSGEITADIMAGTFVPSPVTAYTTLRTLWVKPTIADSSGITEDTPTIPAGWSRTYLLLTNPIDAIRTSITTDAAGDSATVIYNGGQW